MTMGGAIVMEVIVIVTSDGRDDIGLWRQIVLL